MRIEWKITMWALGVVVVFYCLADGAPNGYRDYLPAILLPTSAGCPSGCEEGDLRDGGLRPGDAWVREDWRAADSPLKRKSPDRVQIFAEDEQGGETLVGDVFAGERVEVLETKFIGKCGNCGATLVKIKSRRGSIGWIGANDLCQ